MSKETKSNVAVSICWASMALLKLAVVQPVVAMMWAGSKCVSGKRSVRESTS